MLLPAPARQGRHAAAPHAGWWWPWPYCWRRAWVQWQWRWRWSLQPWVRGAQGGSQVASTQATAATYRDNNFGAPCHVSHPPATSSASTACSAAAAASAPQSPATAGAPPVLPPPLLAPPMLLAPPALPHADAARCAARAASARGGRSASSQRVSSSTERMPAEGVSAALKCGRFGFYCRLQTAVTASAHM